MRTLSYDPRHPTAYHNMAKCLHILGRLEEAKLCMEDLKKIDEHISRSLLCSRLYSDILDSDFRRNPCSGSNTNGGSTSPQEPEHEKEKQEHLWRSKACDYLSHYAGHCNTTTDIKEAVFLGQSGDFIAAGSDDGNLFIWETATGNVVRMMPADDNIVNCVQCHPSASLVATSGIGHTVKFWEPTAKEDEIGRSHMEATTRANQTRMNADPFEMFIMHMGDLAQVFTSREGGVQPRRSLDDDDEIDEDEEIPRHAIEFLRIPRPEGGGGGPSDGRDSSFQDVQCRTC